MQEPHADQTPGLAFQPAALANTAMALYGLGTPRAKRQFTRWTVAGLFVVVAGLSVYRIFSPPLTADQMESVRSLTWLCISSMVVLLTLQTVRNNEDSHRANHDLRGELQPIKTGVDLVERQTNGDLSAKFEAVHRRLGHLESPEFVARIAAAVAVAVRQEPGERGPTDGE